MNQDEMSTPLLFLNMVILALGSICAFIYLAYIYMSSRSVFVTSIAHVTMNNAAASLSYLTHVQDQVLANLGLTLTMMAVVAVLLFKRLLGRGTGNLDMG